MAIDLSAKQLHLPVIPSSSMVRQRLTEVRKDAERLEILLRLAVELEQASMERPPSRGDGGDHA